MGVASMSLYSLLLTVHIISAIVGVGPGFILILVVKKATTMTELRHAYIIRKRIHVFVVAGGTLLLITGLAMGALRPYLFSQGWFVLSLLLFLIALAIGPMILSPKLAPIKVLLKEHKGESIPKAYDEAVKKLFFHERIELAILFIVILLMILKPF